MTPAQFLESAVSLSVQAALVVAATHWLARMVARERTRSRLWARCFQALLLLVLAALLLPHPRLVQPWAGVDRQTGVGLVQLQQQAGRAVFVLWLGGAVVALGLFVLRSAQAARFLRTCTPIDPEALSLDALLGDGQKPQAGHCRKRRVRLLSSPRLAGPFCWQFHRPYIVLPEFMLGFGADRLRLLILHELEHLRTGHPLELFFQRLVEVIFWFHPTVWWASHQAALAREFACDDAAANSRSEIAEYLRTLMMVVEQNSSLTDKAPSALAFSGRKPIVALRARRLVAIARGGRRAEEKRASIAGASASLAATAVLAALVWLPVDVMASPRANWSPWPRWTAAVLHDFGICARDFERYDQRFELYELLEEGSGEHAGGPTVTSRDKPAIGGGPSLLPPEDGRVSRREVPP